MFTPYFQVVQKFWKITVGVARVPLLNLHPLRLEVQFFLLFFFIQFNVPFKIISLIETGQSV